MSNGQTNGIPQGSILMDFIAEIILGYADLELSKKLKDMLHDKKYYILRYRDDYRIFVNDLSVGEIIFKYLCETLLNLGFHLNTSKTCYSQDVVGGALKEDKLDALKYEPVPKKLPKNLFETQIELLRQLLIVQQLGKKFPNSGILLNRLSKISKILKATKLKYYENHESVLTGILIDIGYNNPKCFPFVAGLISYYIPKLPKKLQQELLAKIQEKLCAIHNIGLLEIWIQRIARGINLKLSFNELLCKYEDGDHNQNIFNSDWITNEIIKNILDKASYFDKRVEIKPEIDNKEINVFEY